MIFAANHRSFLDPFVIGDDGAPAGLLRRQEGAVRATASWRGSSTRSAPSRSTAAPATRTRWPPPARSSSAATCVLIFPEGTRMRPGALGRPKRGVGRLALETGAPVVPVAVIGTENVRRGWRIRPHKVRIRAGRPLRFPKVEQPSPQLAGAVTERIWPCVELQWEWLGGVAPIRRAAVIGAGSWGTGLAVALAAPASRSSSAAAPPSRPATSRPTRANDAYLPGIQHARRGRASRTPTTSSSSRADLVVLAVPARALPAAVAAPRRPHPGARRRPRPLQGPRAADGDAARAPTSPSASPPARSPASAAPATPPTRSRTAPRSSPRRPTSRFAASSPTCCSRAGLRGPDARTDVTGVELAGAAKNAAVVAAAAAAVAGPNAAGAAAGKVFAEVDAFARRRGGARRDVRRPRRRRRPRRHRRRRGQPQPPRRRDARPRHGARPDRSRARPGGRGARRAAAARRRRCGERRARARRSTGSPPSSRAAWTPSQWTGAITRPKAARGAA